MNSKKMPRLRRKSTTKSRKSTERKISKKYRILTPSEEFELLLNNVFSNRVNVSNIYVPGVLYTIRTYVHDLAHRVDKEGQFIYGELLATPQKTQKRVYDFSPGTGQSTKQFYAFVKKIVQDKSFQISGPNLWALLHSYRADQLE